MNNVESPRPAGNNEEEKTTEKASAMRVFYLGRDFYSRPQVVLIAGRDKQEALSLFNQLLKLENNPPVNEEVLGELDLSKSSLKIIEPPGNSHLDR